MAQGTLRLARPAHSAGSRTATHGFLYRAAGRGKARKA